MMASANHVIAEFPYSYTDANGLEVSFEKGEQFILLVKATDDWWKVQRMSTSNGDKSNIIYVPANHVKEVKSNCPASPVQDIDSRPGSSHEYMNLDTFRSIMFRSDSTTDSEYSYSDQDTASSFGTSPRVLNGSFSPKPISHTAELRKSLNLEAVLVIFLCVILYSYPKITETWRNPKVAICTTSTKGVLCTQCMSINHN